MVSGTEEGRLKYYTHDFLQKRWKRLFNDEERKSREFKSGRRRVPRGGSLFFAIDNKKRSPITKISVGKDSAHRQECSGMELYNKADFNKGKKGKNLPWNLIDVSSVVRLVAAEYGQEEKGFSALNSTVAIKCAVRSPVERVFSVWTETADGKVVDVYKVKVK